MKYGRFIGTGRKLSKKCNAIATRSISAISGKPDFVTIENGISSKIDAPFTQGTESTFDDRKDFHDSGIEMHRIINIRIHSKKGSLDHENKKKDISRIESNITITDTLV